MIQQNTTQRLPVSVLVYKIIQSVMSSVIFSLLIIALPQTNLFKSLLIPLIFVLNIIYMYFWWFLYSYQVSNEAVTVNSGVIFRSSKIIQFNDVQSSAVHRGPLLALLGLARFDGFTSSPQQLVITRSKSGSSTSHRPDIQIVLPRTEADELAIYAKKGDIQKVQAVA